MGDRDRIDQLLDYIEVLHKRIAELEEKVRGRDDR